MAQVFPALTEIPNLRQKPTQGELHLLEFLANNLDESYEIYFQPFINGDRPDIILMRRNSGVMIIEVKDWNLPNYKLNDKKNWLVTQDRNKWVQIKSPLEQVLAYKENLFNLHIENLLEKQIKNCKMWAFVTCGIYFHCETEAMLKDFLTGQFLQDKNYLNSLSYQEIWGHDSLTLLKLKQCLSKRYLNKKSILFDDELYISLKRYLQPPYHTKEQGKPLNYKPKQEKLSESKQGNQKVTGVAGAGKTYVLAKRAVNALKRIESEGKSSKHSILILTYNITLKNYIHDRISEVRENFSWDSFYITNYHDFITTQLNNLGIKLTIPDDFDDWDSESRANYFEENYYSNLNLFLANSAKISTSNVILIDEVQDYERKWIEIIRNCFLEKNGEYVVFGDEKQNVYERSMDIDKKPYTGIRGQWNKLNQSYRLCSKIAALATQFQRYFFQNKYEVELLQVVQQANKSLEKETIEYIPMNEDSPEKIYQLIDSLAKKFTIHPNDICVQSARIEILRKIDLYARITQNLKTDTTFETQELYYLLLLETLSKVNNKSLELLKIKDQLNYWQNNLIDKNKNISIGSIEKNMIDFFCLGLYQSHSLVNCKLKNALELYKVSLKEYQEWFNKMQTLLLELSRHPSLKNRLENELEKLRKNKKWHFWMNSGNMKLSTIHSFKGWEVDTLFLIIEKGYENNTFTTDELIYTAITRCRRNLFILDLNQFKYSNFFQTALKSPLSVPVLKNY